MNDYQVTVSDGPIDLVTENAPEPLTCPVCTNPYWLVWGMNDFVKVSEKCKCKNQMQTIPTTKDDFEYDDGYGTDPTDLETNEGATDMIKEAPGHFEGSDQHV